MASNPISKADVLKALGVKQPKNNPKDIAATMKAVAMKTAWDSANRSPKQVEYDRKVSAIKAAKSGNPLAAITNPVGDVAKAGLTKVSDVLSRGQYLSANVAKGLVNDSNSDAGTLDTLKHIGSNAIHGISGTDKGNYAQVLDAAGVKNKLVRNVLGFMGDVALDPTTYVGGGIVKGANKAEKSAEFAKSLVKSGAQHEAELVASRAVKTGKNVSPVAKTVAKDTAKVDIAAGENPLKALVQRDAKGRVINSPVIQAKKAKQGEALAQMLGPKTESLVPSDLQQVMDQLKPNEVIPVDPRAIVPQHDMLPGMNPLADVQRQVTNPRLSELSSEQIRAALKTEAERRVTTGGQKAARIELEQKAPEFATTAQKTADALNPGRVQLKVLGKEVTSSEPLYAAGKKAKDFLIGADKPGSFRAALRSGVSTDVSSVGRGLSSEIINSHGANAIRQQTRNAILSRADGTVEKSALFKQADEISRAKIIDKYGQKIDKVPLQLEAEKAGMVDIGNHIYVHKDIADTFKGWKEFKPVSRSNNRIVNTAQQGRDLWKAQAVFSPGTMANNAFGDALNNFFDGVKDPSRYIEGYKAAKGKLTKSTLDVAGVKMSTDKAVEHYIDSGLKRTGLYTVAGKESRAGSQTIDKVLSGKYSPFKMAQKAADTREETMRLAHFFDALEKEGKTAGSVEEAVKKAADRVRKVNHDYTDLTPFEQKLKQFVPFASWPIKNLPLVGKNLLEHPGMVAAIPKAEKSLNNDGGSPFNALKPDYLKGNPTIGFNPKTLASTVFNPRTPYDEVLRTFENPRGVFDPTQQLMPDIKSFMELMNHKKANGAKTGSVADYLTDQVRVVKLFKDLKDKTKTPNEKQQTWIRFVTGTDVREIGATTKKGIAQKAEKKAKDKFIATNIKPTGNKSTSVTNSSSSTNNPWEAVAKVSNAASSSAPNTTQASNANPWETLSKAGKP